MGKIYRNSAVTIAATGSVDSQGGYFQDREPHLVQPCKLHGYLSSSGATAVKQDLYIYTRRWPWLNDGRLNTSGWVFQERLLSPRILHYGSQQLHWECLEHQASEKFPEGLEAWVAQPSREERLKTILNPPTLKSRPWIDEGFAKMLEEQPTRYADWAQLVGLYPQLHLTKSEDILIALSTLANEWLFFSTMNTLRGCGKKIS